MASTRPTRLRSFRGRWRLGIPLLLAAAAFHCSSSPSDSVCGSITSHPDGIRVSDCSPSTITLDDIEYDRNGAKISYEFIVTCGGRTARGTWSRNRSLSCLEGATDPCKSGGICTPSSEADCRNISNCKSWGDCGYRDGKCVPTDDGCAASEVPCGLSGQCHLGSDGTCTVTTHADCQTPFGSCPDCQYKGACATYGNCYADNGRCVARETTDCRKSSQCAFAGKCTLSMNACIAASDGDCFASEVCRTARQCSAVGGICTVKP
jgi:hypothetical protein